MKIQEGNEAKFHDGALAMRGDSGEIGEHVRELESCRDQGN